jgi:RNA polymerase sigma factor (TIGR02999 family)
MTDRSSGPSARITSLLGQWSRGDRSALDNVLPLVYAEIRRIAARQLRRRSDADSLQPTDLVHALFLQLVDQRHAAWENRAQFYAIVSQMMRRILIDHARARHAAKRGGAAVRVPLSDAAREWPCGATRDLTEMLAIDEALDRLARRDSDLVRIVELRFFVGLSVEETGDVLGRSPRTIKREWRVAKAWLLKELRGGPPTTRSGAA